MNIKIHELEKILDSKEIKKTNLKIRSLPIKSSEYKNNDVFTNLCTINEKCLVRFELVEKETIGHQPEGYFK